jgi:hypothetical protein
VTQQKAMVETCPLLQKNVTLSDALNSHLKEICLPFPPFQPDFGVWELDDIPEIGF